MTWIIQSTHEENTMNIFKALGILINTATNTTVKALETIDTTVDAVHDVAKITKATTSQLLAETEEENKQAMKALQALGKDKE